MGRPRRQFAAGYPVHVIYRGNNRQDVFRRDADYQYLWRWLCEASAHFGVAVNAYVFMTNHIHLLVTPRDCESIPRMMHWTARRYSGYFNALYRRTGGLWERRYWSSLVTDDRYLLTCHRYIDLNPVRAGLVRHPADYAWSSHRYYAQLEANSLVTPHDALLELGIDEESRRLSYLALFEEPLSEADLQAIRNSVKSGLAVGLQTRRGPKPKQAICARHE